MSELQLLSTPRHHISMQFGLQDGRIVVFSRRFRISLFDDAWGVVRFSVFGFRRLLFAHVSRLTCRKKVYVGSLMIDKHLLEHLHSPIIMIIKVIIIIITIIITWLLFHLESYGQDWGKAKEKSKTRDWKTHQTKGEPNVTVAAYIFHQFYRHFIPDDNMIRAGVTEMQSD